MRTLEELFEEIRRDGVVGAPVSEGEWKAVTTGLLLPTDLVRFFREIGDGALLEFPSGEFRLSSLAGLGRPEFLVSHAELDWITICDQGDGNSVAIDLSTVDGTHCKVIDVFHETAGEPGQSRVIARSFTEFLDRLLASRGSYWLEPGFDDFGDALDVGR